MDRVKLKTGGRNRDLEIARHKNTKTKEVHNYNLFILYILIEIKSLSSFVQEQSKRFKIKTRLHIVYNFYPSSVFVSSFQMEIWNYSVSFWIIKIHCTWEGNALAWMIL